MGVNLAQQLEINQSLGDSQGRFEILLARMIPQGERDQDA
jgi:hypothetical protein